MVNSLGHNGGLYPLPEGRGLTPLSDKLELSTDTESLINYLFGGIKPLYIFGGFVRDYFIGRIHDTSLIPKDLDVVLLEDYREIPYKIQTNRFGGNFILIDDKRVNWWQLDTTYAFYAGGNLTPTIYNLPSTTVFTCNSLVYDATDHRLYYEENALADIERKMLDFQNTDYLHDFADLQKKRAVSIRSKTGFSPSERVRKFLSE